VNTSVELFYWWSKFHAAIIQQSFSYMQNLAVASCLEQIQHREKIFVSMPMSMV